MSRDYVKERRLAVRGGRDICIKCHLYRTGREDGVCFRCNYEAEHDKILARFGVKHPIPFPAEHKGTELPCNVASSELFMQEEASQEAREHCWSCPVQGWCLDFGMYNNQWGIWGGLTQRERSIVQHGLSQERCALVA